MQTASGVDPHLDPVPPGHPSGLTSRFAALVAPATRPVRLDEACTVLAAHFQVGAGPDGTDLVEVRATLDALAEGVPDRTFGAVLEHVAAAGFCGTPVEDGPVSPSLLPTVLRRRRGLPILLAVVAVEVARRVDVEAAVVGMPGHVLVASLDEPGVLGDPFHRRSALGEADARELFRRIHPQGAPWDPSYLAPIGSRAVLARILANIAQRSRAHRRHREEAVALGLRCMVPGVGDAARGALAAALARSGAFDRAAAELEGLADRGGAGADPDALLARATRWRARLN